MLKDDSIRLRHMLEDSEIMEVQPNNFLGNGRFSKYLIRGILRQKY